MEEFEQGAVDSYELKPKTWLRYVDGTFMIWSRGEEEINGFLQYLNRLQESIKFTVGLEVDNRIPLLDVLVHKQSDSILRSPYVRSQHTQRTVASSRLQSPT
ncbi:hypothetical protein Trydic_g9651 [Trypoxylus dichotomus]